MPIHVRGKAPDSNQTVTVQQSANLDFQIDLTGVTGGRAFDLYKLLKEQPAFYTMASCFDQCKIKDCWVRIVVHTIYPPSACADGRSPLLAVAWDRNGIDDDYSLDFQSVSNYSSAKITQLGSLIVGKPIDTGISARSAQEMLEYVSTETIMSGVPSGLVQWHPTMLVAALYSEGVAYQAPRVSGSIILKTTITFRGVRYIPLGGLSQIAPAVQYYPGDVNPGEGSPQITLLKDVQYRI